MANLSNINGKFVVEQTTGYVGVGTTDPNYPIEVLNASAEIALNASGASIYRLRSDSTDSFRINKNGVGDRLIIDGSGNSTFAGNVTLSGQVLCDTNTTTPAGGEAVFYKSSAGAVLSGYQAILETGSGGSRATALTLDNSQNATFAGNVNAKLSNIAGLQNKFNIENATNTSVLASFGLNLSNDQLILGSDYAASFLLKTGGTTALTIDTSQNSTFANRVSALESFNSVKDGADTVADGPFFALKNAGGTRQYLWQLDASNNIDYWYYNGSTWAQTISLLTNGGATFGGDITTSNSSTHAYLNINAANVSASEAGMFLKIGGVSKWEIYTAANDGNYNIYSQGQGIKLAITPTGNVGIGTTDVEETLTIAKSDGGDGTIVGLRSDASFSQFELVTKNSQVDWGLQTIGARNMYFTTNGTERMRIDSVGLATFRSTYIIAGFYGGEITLGGSDTTFGLQLKYNQDAATTSTLYHSPGYSNDNNLFKLGAGSGNTNQLVLKGDGNVGIGTASPDYILTTQGSGVQRLKVVATDPSQHSSGVYFQVKNGASQVGTGTIATQNNGDMDFYTGSTSEAFRMTILAGGNVGIGTTSPGAKLTVVGGTDTSYNDGTLKVVGNIALNSANNLNPSLNRWALRVRAGGTEGAFDIYDARNSASRIRIDSIGRMGFNSGIETDTRHYFYSNNNTGAATGVARNIKIKSTQYAGTHVQFVGSQGNGGTIGYSNLTASYNTTGSDERLKKNITNWNENILDKFKNIKPKEFHFNQQEDSEEKQKGYIAQNEVDKFPEAYPLLYDDVSKEDRHQFNPSGMVVYLMKAIQELKADNDSLKARIETLENN